LLLHLLTTVDNLVVIYGVYVIEEGLGVP